MFIRRTNGERNTTQICSRTCLKLRSFLVTSNTSAVFESTKQKNSGPIPNLSIHKCAEKGNRVESELGRYSPAHFFSLDWITALSSKLLVNILLYIIFPCSQATLFLHYLRTECYKLHKNFKVMIKGTL